MGFLTKAHSKGLFVMFVINRCVGFLSAHFRARTLATRHIAASETIGFGLATLLQGVVKLLDLLFDLWLSNF